MKQILAVKNGIFSFAEKQIFVDLDFSIYEKDKICLVGKNGAGKSSLMKIIHKEYELNSGEVVYKSGLKIGFLKQETEYNPDLLAYEFVLEQDLDNNKFKADIFFDQLELSGNSKLSELSGGNIKRLAIIKELIKQPDLLFLDEPTNHLDIQAIEWLENYINNSDLTIVCVSHDREFLNRISNKIYLLDSGQLFICSKGFSYFDQFLEELLNAEQKKIEKLNKKLNAENHWLKYGVTARRKRNQQRLRKLNELKEKIYKDKNKIKIRTNKLEFPDLEVKDQSKLVVELKDVTLGIGTEKIIFRNCFLRIMSGEKIGIVGKNGIGKSTFLNLITGKIAPINGTIKIGPKVSFSYADQNRESLDPNKTLIDNICSDGTDMVRSNDQLIHAAGYLKKFLFERDKLSDFVRNLSGGEKNRLLLAKIMLNPGNLLILDEPTNDLDMDSMEMLEELLLNFTGTLIIVSHDRAFLDSLVTRTIVINEKGISDYLGGYSDYVKEAKLKDIHNISNKKNVGKAEIVKDEKKLKKLSYKDQRDLEVLPSQMAELEQEIIQIEKNMANVDLYNNEPDKFIELTKILENKKEKLTEIEQRWYNILELEEQLRSEYE